MHTGETVEHAQRNARVSKNLQSITLETIMKLLLGFLLSLVLFSAHAEKPDLEGGDVVREAWCTQGKKKLLCVAVKKDDKLYVVVLDEKGEYAIYWISPEGNVFLWGRDAI
jgi:hypothetical protein